MHYAAGGSAHNFVDLFEAHIYTCPWRARPV